jgi:myo-inositol-1(or 4)-monophosphatase
MHPFVNTAVTAARAAAKIMMQTQDRIDQLTISEKTNKSDLVTSADIASEQIIIDILRKAYPDHSILAEESGHQPGNDYQWIIDPIDGTMNFAHGFPYFGISIACKYKDKIEHAVIYNPCMNDLFTATRGNGAYKNNRRIRTSKCTALNTSVIATGLHVNAFKQCKASYVQALDAMLDNCAAKRRLGAATLDLAYVASGQLDGFWELGLESWDVAAGSLLIKEAGGLVTDFKGTDDYLNSGNIIAGTPKVFKQLFALIKPLLPKTITE